MAEEKVKVHYNWEIEDIEDISKEESKEEKPEDKEEPKLDDLKPEKKKSKNIAKKELKQRKRKKVKEEKPSEINEDAASAKEAKEENSFKEEDIPKEETGDEAEEYTPKEPAEEFDYEEKEEGFKPGYLVAFAAIIIIVILSFFVLKTKMFPFSAEENIVAIINGEKITSVELEKIYSITVPTEYAGFISKEDFLNQSLIPEKVLLQEAGKQGIKISDEEVQQGLEDFLLENKLTENELKSRLKENDIDFNDFLENFKIRLIITKLLNKTVSSQIIVNDFEIVDYYERNKERFIAQPGQIRARHILAKTEELAKEILEKIEKGADFSELAKEYSIDPTSEFGGDLGFFEADRMVKEFSDAAFSLDIGETSGIVKTIYGYHIIKREGNEVSLEDAKERIRLILLAAKESAAIQTYIDQLVSKADVVINPSASPATTGFTPKETRTFTETGDPVCEEDGKPVIRLFTTSWCPHCTWIKDTFDMVALEYLEQGKIFAYHWDVDIGDNLLTPEQETSIPEEEIKIFRKYNPEGSIPTFVFGCKYKRIGNGYEADNDLRAEEAEFRDIIEELIQG